MSDVVIKVDNVSKLYRLGEIGTGTISHDLNRWWASVRGKEDPFSKVGQVNDRTKKANKSEHVWALKDVNFEIKQGEVLGVIGKNGAGKSTLLKLLSRITAPTTGEIKVKGRVASLLEVGTGMHPEMTGVENVYLNGTILGMTKFEVKNKLEEILDFAGCLKYADTPVKRYSSGMKVRLGFAVAAFLEPEILIVDEVLAVGDAEFQKKAIGKMKDISSENGRTVLFVSHNLGSVKSLCGNSMLFQNGKLEKIGNTNNVVDYYLNNVSRSSDYEWKNEKHNSQDLLSLSYLKIIEENRHTYKSIFMSDPINFEIGIVSNEELHSLNLSVRINSSDGASIISWRLHEVDKNFKIRKGLNKIYLNTKLSALLAGNYTVSIGVSYKGNVLIVKNDLIVFEVMASDIYKSGIIKETKNEYFYTTPEWVLDNPSHS